MHSIDYIICTHHFLSPHLQPWLHFLSVGKSKEAERKRINKELANIRSKFKSKTKHELSMLVGARQLRTCGFVFLFYKHLVYIAHSRVSTHNY